MKKWLKVVHLSVTLSYRSAVMAAKDASIVYLDRIKHTLLCELDYMGGEVSFAHLVEQLPFSASSINAHLRELGKLGYAEIRKDGKERKACLLTAGMDYVKQAKDIFRADEESSCQGMTAAEKNTLRECLGRVGRNMYGADWYRNTPPDNGSHCYYAIRLICRAFNKMAKEDAPDLSLNELKVMYMLRSEEYWLSYKVMEKRALMSQMDVFRCVKNLCSLGYLDCRSLPGDGKAKQARLTKKGAQVADEIYQHSVPWLEQSRAGLSKEEQAELLRLLLIWRGNKIDFEEE